MRTIVFLIVANLGLFAGCVESEPPVQVGQPDELIIRVFLEDGQAVVRLAGLIDDTIVVPFDGVVEIVLVPRDKAAWGPTAAAATVQESGFIDAVLPYFETSIPLGEARSGDGVSLRAEATLPDGSLIRGAHATVF